MNNMSKTQRIASARRLAKQLGIRLVKTRMHEDNFKLYSIHTDYPIVGGKDLCNDAGRNLEEVENFLNHKDVKDRVKRITKDTIMRNLAELWCPHSRHPWRR